MPVSLSEQIISVLAVEEGGPMAVAEIFRRLHTPESDRAAVRAALEELIRVGRLIPRDNGSAVAFPDEKDQFVGMFHATSRGFGFVSLLKPTGREDIFIPATDTLDALGGDLVMVKIVVADKRNARGKSAPGRIIDILRRASTRCVGTLKKQVSNWVVVPDGAVFKAPIQVQDVGAKNASNGDKVVVELVRFARGVEPAQGVITEVLGPHGEPEVELDSVIRQFDLPQEYPAEALEQARRAATEFNPGALTGREDLSREIIVTIDPDDARDFDDAISLRVLTSPEADQAQEQIEALLGPDELDRPGPAAYELGVHIADVAHFVPVESALDMEARQRGNSVYFPRFVIPMLPELLSNGVCSLQQDQPRLTKSAFIRYDKRGRVVSARFANTIIRSRKRLTYRQAQAIIDDARGQAQPYAKGLLDSPPNPHIPEVEPSIRQLLTDMDSLARVIQARRLRQGMIVLELPEVELVMDETGRVIDARPEDDAFSHKIIEMFMVEANEAVARFLTQRGLTVLRRIHPEPDSESTEQVRQFVAVTGRRLPRDLDRSVIQGLLDSVRGTPIAYAVHLSVLKTFSTAEYSPLPMGHYALASENYAHFTSPIRRYADLVIHRCLDSLIGGGTAAKGAPTTAVERRNLSRRKAMAEAGKHGMPPGDGRALEANAAALPASPTPAGESQLNLLMPLKLGNVPDEKALLRLSRHLSFTERRAQNAERELRAVKVLGLLGEHIGDVIDGVVTGLNNFGIFIQSTRFLVEGLIRINDLPPDYWIFDERTASLRGQRTGRRISLGDPVRVQIVAVHLSTRQMDLLLLEHGSSAGGKATLRQVQPRQQPKALQRHGPREDRNKDSRLRQRAYTQSSDGAARPGGTNTGPKQGQPTRRSGQGGYKPARGNRKKQRFHR
ncbi:MAG: VacB/RNase II family 3'-5' exoribonuclease [Phycisphaerae bacterium]|nr:VacB/RNase II family 3'-5' exoribonuclease [Phycisphaerae bacterium]